MLLTVNLKKVENVICANHNWGNRSAVSETETNPEAITILIISCYISISSSLPDVSVYCSQIEAKSFLFYPHPAGIIQQQACEILGSFCLLC